MTPVDQQFFFDSNNNRFGDCARAVLASLLDLPLQAVPHFLQEVADTGHVDAPAFYDRIDAWLLSQGYEIDWHYTPQGAYATEYCYIGGPSPRGQGLSHAVVGQGGRVVHDPHPSRAGLLPGQWAYGYLVPLAKR